MSYGHNYFYQARERERQGNQPEIGDWWDSTQAKKIVTSFGLNDIFLHMTGDGFQLFRSKNHETGILDISMLNLRPKIRSKNENTFVYGVIPGPKLPSDWNSILKPFVEELKKIYNDGKWKNTNA